MKKIKSALISVYHKDGLDNIVKKLSESGVTIYSTGGTLDYISSLGIEARSVESLTGYPSILGGRVKTLHPAVMGGILARRNNEKDRLQMAQYNIPEIDLVIVDLYPFRETVASGADENDIIEKIDIGGISLIRAAAKNFKDTVIISHCGQYAGIYDILCSQNCATTSDQRRRYAAEAFMVSSGYDSAIFDYFAGDGNCDALRISHDGRTPLRYGENPHQKAAFYGSLSDTFVQLHGKEISYNNLLDIDAAVSLISEFDGEPAFAILKHNNACGVAVRPTLLEAWTASLACDPVSAFGGVVVCNRTLDMATAVELNKLFCEVVIAPGYDEGTLELLKSKKNRIILQLTGSGLPARQMRSLLGGVVVQERDTALGGRDSEMKTVTRIAPAPERKADLILANTLVKHSKSNAIVLVRDGMLLASGIGQTSRVDALRQAIDKANSFGFDLRGAVMASDAFFPFADCVEIAHDQGIDCIIQPGGSVRDQESIDYCDHSGIAMVFTGMRHFKH